MSARIQPSNHQYIGGKNGWFIVARNQQQKHVVNPPTNIPSIKSALRLDHCPHLLVKKKGQHGINKWYSKWMVIKHVHNMVNSKWMV